MLLAIPIYPLIRRVLRPAIVDDVAALGGAGAPITRGRVAAAPRARGRRVRRAAGVWP